ncbi:DNA primase, partial [Streptomyces sp. SID685]|nr:DNA primase [Streptomyces sp. SID685]
AARAMVTELAVEPILRRTVDETYAGTVLVQIRRRAVERRIRDIEFQMTRLSSGGDPGQLAAVQNEMWILQQYDQSLRERGAAAL